MRMRIKNKTANGLPYTRFCRNQGRVIWFAFYSACGMSQARRDSTAHVQPPASPLGFSLMFTDVELLWWSPSRLVSGCFWCSLKCKRPSLTYHPTCSRTFVRGVWEPFTVFGFGESLSGFPEIDLPPWTCTDVGPKQRPKLYEHMFARHQLSRTWHFQDRRSRTGTRSLVKAACFFSLQPPKVKGRNSWKDPHGGNTGTLLNRVKYRIVSFRCWSSKPGAASTANDLQNPILVQSG